MRHPAEPVRLLAALSAAGCDVFVDDGEFHCSPPMRHIEWADPEAAIEEWRDELRDLLLDEGAIVVQEWRDELLTLVRARWVH
jgi:hypothetical protein